MSTEVEKCRAMILQFRVSELQQVLTALGSTRYGRKCELQKFVFDQIRSATGSQRACAVVREVFSQMRGGSSGNVIGGAPMMNPGGHQRSMSTSAPTRVGPPIISSRMNSLRAPPGHWGPPPNFHSNHLGSGMLSNGRYDIGVKIGILRGLRVTNLPFFDRQATLLELSELQASTTRNIDCTSKCSFTINQPIVLAELENRQPNFPKTEIQFRIFQNDPDIEQADDFPPNFTLLINGDSVNLPPLIPTNRPNTESKRLSRPVDISTKINARAPSQSVTIQWTADKRSWAFGIWIVKRLDSGILLQRMKTRGTKRPVEYTKGQIIKMLNNDDDAIALDSLKISLMCPLSKQRMNIPSRSEKCTHFQCFDLDNFLRMNEKRPSWKCPICNADAHFSLLLIDNYFLEMIKQIDPRVIEVELLRDGAWKEVLYDNDSSDDEDSADVKPDVKVVTNGKTASTSGPTSSGTTKKNDHFSVITIDSSDDDGDRSAVIPVPSLPPQPPRFGHNGTLLGQHNGPYGYGSVFNRPTITASVSASITLPVSSSGAKNASGGGSSSKRQKKKQRRGSSSTSEDSASSSDESDRSSPRPSQRPRKVPRPKTPPTKKKAAIPVITLTSSSEDEASPSSVGSAASSLQCSSATPASRDNRSSTSADSIPASDVENRRLLLSGGSSRSTPMEHLSLGVVGGGEHPGSEMSPGEKAGRLGEPYFAESNLRIENHAVENMMRHVAKLSAQEAQAFSAS